MNKVESFIERLVREYKYKPLPKDKSLLARQWYEKHLPNLNADKPIYSLNNELIADNFNRIVIGDYGAFIEFLPEDSYPEAIKVKSGEEYRTKSDFKGKYVWLTTESNCCKIYYQLRPVKYADYKPKNLYISPYEVHQWGEFFSPLFISKPNQKESVK